MKTVIPVLIAAYCACRWIQESITIKTLLWYMQKKDIPFPEERDIKEGTRWVIERTLDDLFPWRNRH